MGYVPEEAFLAGDKTGQPRRHPVHRRAQPTDLIPALLIHLHIELPFGNLLRRPGHLRNRPRHAADQRQPENHREHQQPHTRPNPGPKIDQQASVGNRREAPDQRGPHGRPASIVLPPWHPDQQPVDLRICGGHQLNGIRKIPSLPDAHPLGHWQKVTFHGRNRFTHPRSAHPQAFPVIKQLVQEGTRIILRRTRRRAAIGRTIGGVSSNERTLNLGGQFRLVADQERPFVLPQAKLNLVGIAEPPQNGLPPIRTARLQLAQDRLGHGIDPRPGIAGQQPFLARPDVLLEQVRPHTRHHQQVQKEPDQHLGVEGKACGLHGREPLPNGIGIDQHVAHRAKRPDVAGLLGIVAELLPKR